MELITILLATIAGFSTAHPTNAIDPVPVNPSACCHPEEQALNGCFAATKSAAACDPQWGTLVSNYCQLRKVSES